MIPGANVLAAALGVIGAQRVQYRQYLGDVVTSSGIRAPSWAEPVPVDGSLQPVDTTQLQTLGLDLEKTYCTFYTPRRVTDLGRDRAGDRITYGRATYQVIGAADWYLQDGWVRVLCVEVPSYA